MHKLIVNPQILQKFKTYPNRITCTISDEFEYLIVKDQDIWLLSTIFEFELPNMHLKFGIKIYNYFNAQMKVILLLN